MSKYDETGVLFHVKSDIWDKFLAAAAAQNITPTTAIANVLLSFIEDSEKEQNKQKEQKEQTERERDKQELEALADSLRCLNHIKRKVEMRLTAANEACATERKNLAEIEAQRKRCSDALKKANEKFNEKYADQYRNTSADEFLERLFGCDSRA